MARVDAKVVLLGQSGTGKSCLLDRYVTGAFETDVKNTVGSAFAAKRVKVSSGQTISVGVWDTAGAEQFEALSRMYYHGSRAAIVCFDASRASSFNKLKFWVEELREHEPDCRLYFAQTKADLLTQTKADLLADDAGFAEETESQPYKVEAGRNGVSRVRISSAVGSAPRVSQRAQREVAAETVQQYAKAAGAQMFETSARTGVGVAELFQQIAEDLAAAVPAASEQAAYSCSPPQQDAPARPVQRAQQQRTVLLTQLQQQQAAGRRRQEQLWACC